MNKTTTGRSRYFGGYRNRILRLSFCGIVACVLFCLLAFYYSMLSGHSPSNIDLQSTRSVYKPPIMDIKPEDVTLLIDGVDLYPVLLRLIKNATKTIYVESYTWRDDNIGNEVGRALLEAAEERNIQITIRKDKIGEIHEKSEDYKQSFFHKDFYLKLFLLEKFYNYWWYPEISDHSVSSWTQQENVVAKKLVDHERVDAVTSENNGDHSKVWIFDDDVVICGGINVEDKAVGVDVKGRHWMDFMIMFKGEQYVEMFRSRKIGQTSYNEESSVNFIFNKDWGFEMKDRIMKLLSDVKKEAVLMNSYWSEPDFIDRLVEMHKEGIKLVIVELSSSSELSNDLRVIPKNREQQKEEFRIRTNRSVSYEQLFARKGDVIGRKMVMGRIRKLQHFCDEKGSRDMCIGRRKQGDESETENGRKNQVLQRELEKGPKFG